MRLALRSCGGGRFVARLGLLRLDLVRVIFERLCLRQEGECLLNHRIPVGQNTQTGDRSILAGQNAVLDVDLEPFKIVCNVLIGKLHAFIGEVLLEAGNHGIVYLEVAVDGGVGGEVERRVMEEDVVVENFVLEVIGLGGFDLFVGSDSAAAIDGAAGVGHLHFAIVSVGSAGVIVVVVVKRNAFIVALNEAAGRRVVVVRGERQAGVFAEVVDRLHQAFAE